jgi:hypothetical protein
MRWNGEGGTGHRSRTHSSDPVLYRGTTFSCAERASQKSRASAECAPAPRNFRKAGDTRVWGAPMTVACSPGKDNLFADWYRQDGWGFPRRTLDPTTRVRPSMWQCLWGAPLFLIGGIFFAYTTFHGLMHVTDSLTQVMVPGQTELSLKGGVTYTVFLEEQSVVGGKVYSTTQSIEGLACHVTTQQNGTRIGISEPSTAASYDVNGRSGHSVLEFHIPQDGRYLFACDYGENSTGPNVVVAVGSGVGGAISRTVFVGLAAFFGGCGGCVAVVFVVLVMRQHVRAR